MSFKKYITKFKSNENLTHLSFEGGKYTIPDKSYDEFYKMYFDTLINGEESLSIIEKINEKTKFGFFLDIEVPKSSNEFVIKKGNIKLIIDTINKCIKEIFETTSQEYIITRRNDKYHINWYNLIVNSVTGQTLAKKLIELLPQDLKKLIDISVYRTGLRLFGSKKSVKSIEKEMENYTGDLDNYSDVYEIYDINNNELHDNQQIEYSTFMKLVVRKRDKIQLVKVKESFKEEFKKVNNPKKIVIKSLDDSKINNEIQNLLLNIKENYLEILEKYSLKVLKIVSTQNKAGIFVYYITIQDTFCPFYCREHRRESSPIYVEISISGIYIKCHDQDCLGRKYPDEGFELPQDTQDSYPTLYESMTTKYWKSDIVLTQDIKKLLEDSLTGSHYKIAKVIFNIYKDRFRIDDIKNADWYEFNGNTWQKTHIMNILISEELHRYYKGIKISDTAVMQNEDLQDFIKNKDQLEANMRNNLVDNITNKLENVQFKKYVMSEMHYLFKSHEPNFIEKLDANLYLMGFNNGVYDFEKQVFRKGDQKDYITLSTGYDYLEYTDCEETRDIYAFLGQIIPNKIILEYLLKVLARSLIGVPDEKFYILTGLAGSNGKSTLINFLEYALGDYMTSADVSLLTNKKGLSSSASPDVIRLKGKRIVGFAEPETNDTLKTSIIKTFSGDDLVIARELYKAPISFKLQASNILCCNDIPAINSVDGGVMRRLKIVEFTSRFCNNPNPKKKNEFKTDPTIRTKIKNWKRHFMAILIHYYSIYTKEVEENGCIFEPKEVLIATSRYRDDNDKFNEYITECVIEGNRFTEMKKIYNHFNNWWCNSYSNIKIPDIKELKKSLKIKFGEEITQLNKIGFKVDLIEEINNEIEDDY
jgi:P4 family phage/plasmid primase-like protien